MGSLSDLYLSLVSLIPRASFHGGTLPVLWTPKFVTCMYIDATGIQHVTVLDRMGPSAGLANLVTALAMQAKQSLRHRPIAKGCCPKANRLTSATPASRSASHRVYDRSDPMSHSQQHMPCSARGATDDRPVVSSVLSDQPYHLLGTVWVFIAAILDIATRRADSCRPKRSITIGCS